MNKVPFLIASVCILLYGCTDPKDHSDAFGNFEAVEIVVSAEMSGVLRSLNLELGDQIEEGASVGLIDTTQVHLQIQQLVAQEALIESKLADFIVRTKIIEEQHAIAEREFNRINKLFEQKAATDKQLDDAAGQLRLLTRQIDASRTQQKSIEAEFAVLNAQKNILIDQINRAFIVNPVKGTVIGKYVEPGELVARAKPMYRIANLKTMYLRAYITGDQLPVVGIGQNVTVVFDKNESSNQTVIGKISWISAQAEFTPKHIQTKKDRVTLVYAIKVLVPNNGSIKIGMPGEIVFN